jgi:hypothetical protein
MYRGSVGRFSALPAYPASFGVSQLTIRDRLFDELAARGESRHGCGSPWCARAKNGVGIIFLEKSDFGKLSRPHFSSPAASRHLHHGLLGVAVSGAREPA